MKKLNVSCATCDIRNISEKILESYQEIAVNAATIVSSPAANERMAGYQVQMNAATILSASEETELKSVNGSLELKGGEIDHPTLLLVNGSLELGEDAEASLKNITLIHVNGRLTYPSGLESLLPPLQVNGSIETYPSGAIRMKSDGIVDRMFLLRAKRADYYTPRQVLLLDEKLDLSTLAEKEVHFLTPKAYVASSLLEAALPLFSDDTEITEVPDGCSYLNGEVELTDRVLRKYGPRLFLSGSLLVHQEGRQALESLSYLRVLGKTTLLGSDLGPLLDQIEFHGAEPVIIRGALISEKASLTVDAPLLERNPEGITFTDCATVKLADDITAEQIEKLLCFKDCAMIQCGPGQREAVMMVSQDVACVDDGSEGSDHSLGDILKSALLPDPEVNHIRAAKYVF